MSATRPKLFISPLQLGLSVFLHRKFESKNKINILSSLGFRSTYYEALLFEASFISHLQPDILPDSFTQFVFDNADFNVNILDGLHSFHSMGVTPSSAVCPTNKINRLKNLPSADSKGNFRQITFKTFQPSNNGGLQNVIFDDIINFSTVIEYVISQPHLLWIFGKFMNIPVIPEWSAFMAEITKNEPFLRTSILPLRFVNSPPSNYDTIYTVILRQRNAQ